ncbi:MAG: T9SS type A sorting domain-containing protein [Flavobacteriales bacterium]|nr:T9SS type A sorting domain-containing protein [Flavobacteriales bacterium]
MKAIALLLLLLASTVHAQYVGGAGGGGDTNCGAALQILPVELLYFTATPMGAEVALHWATATEHNNAGFAVERSGDGRTFEAIEQVQGAGNSVQLVDYNATDRAPLSGINYYRLLQTDFDGTTHYSDVVSVTFAQSELFAYPNPVEDQVWLRGTSAGEEVSVHDAMGRLLLAVTATDGPVVVDLSAFPAGHYVVRVAGPGSLRTLAVVKR